jgi:nitrate reductase NapE component
MNDNQYQTPEPPEHLDEQTNLQPPYPAPAQYTPKKERIGLILLIVFSSFMLLAALLFVGFLWFVWMLSDPPNPPDQINYSIPANPESQQFSDSQYTDGHLDSVRCYIDEMVGVSLVAPMNWIVVESDRYPNELVEVHCDSNSDICIWIDRYHGLSI